MKKKIDTLYIVGNGFDLHHRLDTWYSSFGLHLKNKDSEIYDNLVNYLGLPEIDEDNQDLLKNTLWSDFEALLATLDIDYILEEHRDLAYNPHSIDASDGDWHTIEVLVGLIRDALTIEMFKEFKEFIRDIKYTPKEELDLLNIDQNAIFFNFNYTNSLERYYNIEKSQILHIHNRADSDEKLILGHGINPSNIYIEEDIKVPEGLSNEDLNEWWQNKYRKNYDYSVEIGRQELIKYFSQSFKPSSILIENNKSFFASLNGIKKVYILGHSLGDVDDDYFIKIINSINNAQTDWIISFYDESEINEKREKLLIYGLSEKQINITKIVNI